MPLTSAETERIRVYVVGPAPSAGPFDIPFPFYDADEVEVYVGNVLVPGVTITQLTPDGTAGNTVMLDDPVSNTTVSIVSAVGGERATGDTFVQVELSKEIDRIFARLQEIGQRGFFVLPDNVSIDVGGRRLSNLMAPVLPTDAATKAYADVNITAGLGVINAARDAAVAAVDAEENSALDAIADQVVIAEGHATAAAGSAAAADSDAATATTKAGEAAASAAAAATSETNAAASAAAAAASAGSMVKATQAQAEAGADDTAYMTALKSKQQVDARVATQAEAKAGTDNTKLMTPLRVAEAIDARPFRGAAVASTSGTAIDFTGIPSWAKRVTVMFNEVSTNGTSIVIMQLGSVSGFTTSGYVGVASFNGASGQTDASSLTTGFGVTSVINAASRRSGSMTIFNLSGDTWTASGTFASNNTTPVHCGMCGGFVAVGSGPLTRLRITTVNGTDTFDGGSINIMWE